MTLYSHVLSKKLKSFTSKLLALMKEKKKKLKRKR